MKTMLALILLLISAPAVAQETVNQGKPGLQGPWPVTGTVTLVLDGGLQVKGPIGVTGTDGGTQIVNDSAQVQGAQGNVQCPPALVPDGGLNIWFPDAGTWTFPDAGVNSTCVPGAPVGLPMTNRINLFITNISGVTDWWGFGECQSTATATPLFTNANVSIDASYPGQLGTLGVFCVQSGATLQVNPVDTRWTEVQ